MKIVSSYKVRLQDNSNALAATAAIYQEALSLLTEIAEAEWAYLAPIYNTSTQSGQAAMERLVHKTAKNPSPKYDFDTQFYKFPSYFRRAAISAALGVVSSYHSNLVNWEAAGKAGKVPRLSTKGSMMPTFFRDNMSRSEEMLLGKGDAVELKLFVNHDWVWVPIQCRHQDVKYLAKYWSTVKASAPTLTVKRKGPGKRAYYLCYAFEETRNLALRDELLHNRTILAVDLGINTDAVCSVMQSDGTVIARRFIDFPMEKDLMTHTLNIIKKLQRAHGRTGGRHEWAKVSRINDELSKKVASAIVDMANEFAVNVIVFEKLPMSGKKKGSKRRRLHMWKKNSIQETVTHKAHRCLIRISHVCAWGTSRLAFDGSGPLTRDEHNHKLATFANKKQYNCDLSASYNIGARYFLREYCSQAPELLKTLPKASRRVYADLRNLVIA